MGTLYIVASPIGNLGDISSRTKAILEEVSYVVAEDTRVVRRLLSSMGLKKQVLSFHAHSSQTKLYTLAQKLEQVSMAYLCDAGTPGISDPGASLVKLASNLGYKVSPIPGSSAVTSALSVSGFSSDRFLFVGFLRRTINKRRTELQSLLDQEHTFVFFESPYRVVKTLELIAELDQNRRVCVCRELTKVYEEVVYGTPSEVLQKLNTIKGEFTVVVEGK